MIKKIRKKFLYFKNIKFVRDIFTLQIGSFFSTGLNFIASVAYARVLGPENYGQYALIFAFVSLLSVIENWGATNTVLTLLSEAWNRRDKEEIRNLIIFFVKISLIITFTVGILVVIISPYFSQLLYGSREIGYLSQWVLVASIITFVYMLLTIILQVTRKISHLTIIENINHIIYFVIPVSLVFMGYGLNGIVWGNFISAVIFLLFSMYFYHLMLKKTDLLPSFKDILFGLKDVSIKKYFKFGLFIAIDKNLANLYSTLPMIFLGMFVVDAEIGYFKIAFSYIGLSLIFLKPVSRLLSVQLPKSKVYGHKELRDHFYKTAFYSFLMTIVVLVPMLVMGSYLVKFFYGPEYSPSIKMIYMLWPYALINSVGIGVAAMFRTIKKVGVVMVINAVNILIGVPIFYLLIKNYGLEGMAITIVSWLGLAILFDFIYINYYLNRNKNV